MTRYRPGTGGTAGPQGAPRAWPCEALRAEIGYLARLDDRSTTGVHILRVLARAPMLAELAARATEHGRRCAGSDLCGRCQTLAGKAARLARAERQAQTYARLRVSEWVPDHGLTIV